jgi:hypothetical protein
MARFGRGYPSQHLWTPNLTLQTVTVDAVGAGVTSNASSFSFSSGSVTAGATVYVDVTLDANGTSGLSVTSVTYGGTSMAFVASVPLNNVSSNGNLYRYKLAGAVAGPQTVLVTLNNTTFETTANSVSFLNVQYDTTQSVYGLVSGGISQSASCPSKQMILQSFGCDQKMTSPSGGTNRYTSTNGFAGLVMNTAGPGSTTFSASASTGTYWSGLSTVLV